MCGLVIVPNNFVVQGGIYRIIIRAVCVQFVQKNITSKNDNRF